MYAESENKAELRARLMREFAGVSVAGRSVEVGDGEKNIYYKGTERTKKVEFV